MKLTGDRAMQAQLDRLVTSELAENDRRSLLAWLDEDAGRWRACAIAFLEAQTWDAAAGAWPAPRTGHATATKIPPAESCRPPRRELRAWTRVLALAAATVFAFFAGHVSSQFWPVRPQTNPPAAPLDERGPLMASVNVRTSLHANLPAQLQVPVTRVAAAASPAPAISEYERKQWEKRGFELHEELRYLPARLPDGSDVLVPVNKIQVKFKGTPVS